MAKRGRPTDYTPELAFEICTRIAAGESLNGICQGEKMPAKSTVLGWVVDDREGFYDQYRRAREAAGYGEGDEVAEIGRFTLSGAYEPNAARVAIDALKWSAARKAPKGYGDKQQHEHTGAGGGPIQTEALGETELARRLAFLLTKGADAG